MLEKITTKPPISKMVEMLLLILSAKISPRLEKEAVFFVCLKELDEEIVENVFLSFFQ